jgi:hypothetical protein
VDGEASRGGSIQRVARRAVMGELEEAAWGAFREAVQEIGREVV